MLFRYEQDLDKMKSEMKQFISKSTIYENQIYDVNFNINYSNL